MLGKSIIGMLGVVFGLLVLAFTGMQTFNLLMTTTENVVISVVGLIFFEGGLLYWWFVFQEDAEGLGQLALSALMAGFGLILVVMATALELGAIDSGSFGEGTGARLIVAAAIVNLIGKFLYPLLSPDVSENIFLRSMEGRITKKAQKDAEGKAEQLSVGLADRVGREIARRMEYRMLVAYGLDATAVEKLPLALPEQAAPIAEDEGKMSQLWGAMLSAVGAEKKTAVTPSEPVVIEQEQETGAVDGVDIHNAIFHEDGTVEVTGIAEEQYAPVSAMNGNGAVPN